MVNSQGREPLDQKTRPIPSDPSPGGATELVAASRLLSPLRGVRRAKVLVFLWVRIPPGNWSFQPEAAEVVVEVTKP